MMRRRIIYIFSFLILGAKLSAQVVNDGLPIAVTSGLDVAVGSNFTSRGAIANEGSLFFRDSVTFAGTYSGNGTVTLNGTGQMVDFQGAVVKTLIASGGDKTLISALTADTLIFNAARLLTNGQIFEVLGDISGYNGTSHVVGKLIRPASDTVLFPVAKGGIYSPVSLTGISGTTPAIGVEVFEANPNGTAGYGLLAVASNRYWDITQEGGVFTSAFVELPVLNETIAPGIADLSVARGTLNGAFAGLGQSSRQGDLASGFVKAAVAGGPGTYALGKSFDETLRTADSLALVAIYDSTGGTGWTDNSGWLSAGLDSWTGVTLTDKRVVALAVPNNNLQKNFPNISLGLETLTDLNLSSNELSGFGDISSLSALQSLNVSGNRLQFGDLENILAFFPAASYAPQKEVLERVRTVQEIGTQYTVDRTVTGSNNSYTWLKNGASISETSAVFTVSVSDFSVDGQYIARVTNPNVPGLTLNTQPVVLRVSSLERDSTSLRAIYDSLVTGQSTVSSWTTLPMAQWSEITIAGQRVTAIDLSGKGLEGELPEEIMDLQELTSVNLSNNKISGLPAMGTSLPNINTFNVSDNALQFDDLEPNVTVNGITYASQAKAGKSSSVVIPSGNSQELGVDVGGLANQYQWYLTSASGKLNNQPIGSATSNTFTVQNVSYENMGTYVVRTTNPVVPGLTIESYPMEVLASADLEFYGVGKDGADITEGFGYALKVREKGKPFDSVAVIEPLGGSFLFDNLILGDYLIAFESDTTVYLPTYFRNTDLWAEADTLRLRADRADTLYMVTKPVPLTPDDGDGVVKGFVEANFADEAAASGRVEARRKVKKAGCSLRKRTRGSGGRTNQEDYVYELVAYVETNDEGQFEFVNIPAGFYRFNIEYPGIPMDTSSFVEFEIGAGGVEDNTFKLEAYVTENGIEVVKAQELGFYRRYFKDLQLYPNPADKVLNLSYAKLVSDAVVMRVLDLSGNVILQQAVRKGYHRSEQIDTSGMETGMYLVTFEDTASGNKRLASFKIYVRH